MGISNRVLIFLVICLRIINNLSDPFIPQFLNVHNTAYPLTLFNLILLNSTFELADNLLLLVHSIFKSSHHRLFSLRGFFHPHRVNAFSISIMVCLLIIPWLIFILLIDSAFLKHFLKFHFFKLLLLRFLLLVVDRVCDHLILFV